MTIDFHLYGQTHIAHLAVKEILCSANATNTAGITMILLFVRIIKEIAYQAGVLR